MLAGGGPVGGGSTKYAFIIGNKSAYTPEGCTLKKDIVIGWVRPIKISEPNKTRVLWLLKRNCDRLVQPFIISPCKTVTELGITIEIIFVQFKKQESPKF